MHEIDIRKKPMLGQGAYHNVYDYASAHGKVIKTKQNGDLNIAEIKMFNMNPSFCAKVYKYTDRYAILEKLDVPAFKADELRISRGIFHYLYAKPRTYVDLPYSIDVKLTDVTDLDVPYLLWKCIDHGKHKTLKELSKFCPPVYNGWVVWFNDLYNNFHGKSTDRLDIHDQNLGYNKEGELRLLDL